MRICKISLRNFRNYEQLQLEPSSSINLFIGDNAQGKTNLLEALYLICTGHSHRSNRYQELIRWNHDCFYVAVEFDRKGVRHIIHFTCNTENKREIIVNDNPLKIKQLIGYLNTVLFSPEDLQIVKGGPDKRRKFLDIEISQVNNNYYHSVQQYNKILMQRNTLLRRIRMRQCSMDLLIEWDTQLTAIGSKIIKKRLEVIKKLSMLARLMHRRITNGQEEMVMQYVSTVNLHYDNPSLEDISEQYRKDLTKNCRGDIERGYSSIGPHRDDINFFINGVNLKAYGSQGQQRTGALALKLAELEFMKSETGEYPVLLLDDVMSELDEYRRFHLLDFIKENIQTFITGTQEEDLSHTINGCMYRIVGGKVAGGSYVTATTNIRTYPKEFRG